MGRGLESRLAKGVSPTLAAVLLIMITLSAAVALYSYVQRQLPAESNTVTSAVGLAEVELGIDLATGLEAKYVEITVFNPSPSDLLDYPVRIRINASNFNDWASLGPGGVFFVGGEGLSTPLDYWVQWLDRASQDMLVWVKVPRIPAGGSAKVYMGYNTSVNPYEDLNDPGRVFFFYDGAEDGVLGAPWGTQYGNGIVVYNDTCAFQGNLGLLKDGFNDPNGARKNIGTSLLRSEGPIALEFWVYRFQPWTGGNADRVGLVRAVGDGYGWTYGHAPTIDMFVDVRTGFSLDATLDSTPNDPPDLTNTWYRGVLYIFPNGSLAALRYTFDDALLNIVQVSNSTYTVFDTVYILGGQDYCVDEIIVRKGAGTEPHSSLSPTPSGLSIITLYPKNLGNTPLNLSRIYVTDLSTKALVFEAQLTGVLEPGATGRVELTVLGGSGYYEVLLTTAQGVKSKILVSARG